jgi:hypothetical protein
LRLLGLLPARARFLGQPLPFAGKFEPSCLVVIAPGLLGQR